MADECIFCKIADGQIPSFKIYEDNLVKAILDRNPASPGHILIISKEHHETIFDTPEETLNQIIDVSKKIGSLVKERLGATGLNTLKA